MLIGKHEGDQLLNYIRRQVNTGKYSIVLSAEFMMPQNEDNMVNVEMWYSSNDDKSLDFVRNIAVHIEPLLDSIRFEPKFVTFTCPFCTDDFKKKSCVSDGKYCATSSA